MVPPLSFSLLFRRHVTALGSHIPWLAPGSLLIRLSALSQTSRCWRRPSAKALMLSIS